MSVSREQQDTSLHNVDDWLTLWAQPGIGPVNFHRLMQSFDTPTAALSASDSDWSACNIKPSVISRRNRHADIAPDLAWLEAPGHHLLSFQHDAYPESLKQLPAAPPLLYVNGDIDVLSLPQLSIVGSRNPTQSGKNTAQAFAQHFASAGLTITSGMAMGIDTIAHTGALDSDGITIAVCGTGLNQVYPARNRALAEQIIENGALISEFPVNTSPRAENFPRRNRIISGISLGTLVIEAAQRSGSLITARYAMEQGRDVFAIPGSIHNPLARGCHKLIRQGAKLVETAADVLEELAPLIQIQTQNMIRPQTATESDAGEPSSTLDPDHQRVLQSVDYDATTIDAIIRKTELTSEEVSSILLILELEGRVASEPGGYFTRLGS